jgi:membrane-associated phospholipid phosphatase
VDWRVLHTLNQWAAHRDGVADVVARLANATLAVLLLGVVVYWLSERPRSPVNRRAAALFGLAAGGVAMLGAELVRELALRPAPAVAHPTEVAVLSGGPAVTFPSVSVAGAVAIAACLVWRGPRRWIVALVLAGIVGVAEIADGVGYPTDELSGAALGLAAASLACTVGREPLTRAAQRLSRALDPYLEPVWWWFEWPG